MEYEIYYTNSGGGSLLQKKRVGFKQPPPDESKALEEAVTRLFPGAKLQFYKTIGRLAS